MMGWVLLLAALRPLQSQIRAPATSQRTARKRKPEQTNFSSNP